MKNLEWQSALKIVMQHPNLHAKFLNTLSLMEYIGARKIIKSQNEFQINLELLSHAAEEIRHAQILKRLALRVSPDSVPSYAEDCLVCSTEARAYMQCIDHAVEEIVGRNESYKNYLLTTLIIEERAKEFYPYYEGLLAEQELSGYAQAIVSDEERHLVAVKQSLQNLGLFSDSFLIPLRALETELFLEIFKKLLLKNSRR